MIRFYVCIIGRNLEHAWVEKNIRSVLEQETVDIALDLRPGRPIRSVVTGPVFGKEPYQLTIDWTDDASDNARHSGLYRARAMLEKDASVTEPNGHLWTENRVRMGGLHNFYRAIHRAADDDVIVLLGGDDWIDPGSLERVAKLYEDPECWLTYGTWKNDNGKPTHQSFEWDGCELRDQFHEFLWMPFTCRAWLAKKVREEDLKMGGNFFPSSGDVALNIPIVEMAGPEHARWIEEPWYNRRIHEQNDTSVDAALQYFCSWKAYAKPRYSRILGRNDEPTRTAHTMNYGLAFKPDENENRSLPQGIKYGEQEAFAPRNKQVAEWVNAELRKSLACPLCQGMKRCACIEDPAAPLGMPAVK